MPNDSPSRAEDGPSNQRREEQAELPFTGNNVPDEEAFRSVSSVSSRPRPSQRLTRSASNASSVLSSSVGHRVPVRSFVHQTSHNTNHDHLQYSSDGVREQTQQLASWTIGSLPSPHTSFRRFPTDADVPSFNIGSKGTFSNNVGIVDRRMSLDTTEPIEEVSEPATPASVSPGSDEALRSSLLSHMIRTSPPKDVDGRISSGTKRGCGTGRNTIPSVIVTDADTNRVSEETPLLPKSGRQGGSERTDTSSTTGKIEQWKRKNAQWSHFKAQSKSMLSTLAHPKRWDKRAVWKKGVVLPASTLPAVFLGWLLNILDALSYGMILFPLGSEIFADTGPDGISMFFVSCIVSQLVYSCGGSIFKGAVGSEMIEVVPFFHKMTEMIIARMDTADARSIRATTITSYAISSILTGLIFLALGTFKLGSLMSFFPRSILSGCIGGVGIFLFITGIEVSARLDSGIEYNLDTLEKLFAPDTVLLWVTPLLLAILLFTVRRFYEHPIVLPLYFISITLIFYFFVLVIPSLNLPKLRDAGWIFEKPESGKPFYNFYTFYDFRAIDWGALVSCIPTMFALSFFGIIHVPINVPALGLAVGEDDVDANRELIAHGISNTLSGCVGSIQNYLVYANSIMFYKNGGDSRLAGILLAVATTATWFAGPGAIGYIPVMIVGTLIYLLGIDLIKESLWDTVGRVQKYEFLMILTIALVMGLYDFVVGIVAGIVLACLLYVLQSSRVSAVRATYTGAIAESTVRRHPVQRKFLHQVGSQIYVVKLAGYLFFGTIVAVENKVRGIVDEVAFKKQPIRYLIFDFSHVDGIDFSAAEGFSRIHRILKRRDVEMCLSGVSMSGDVGRSLTMVGLLDEESADVDYAPPKVYEDLNRALEACENDLLIAFKRRGETEYGVNAPQIEAQTDIRTQIQSSSTSPSAKTPMAIDAMHNSPRRQFIQQAAQTTLSEYDTSTLNKYSSFKQPLPLILQTFHHLTDKDLDFWHQAAPFFEQRQFPKGTVIYSRGDEPDGFYILQEGIMRADYDLEQGHYYESIVAGTTCGELPFFSESERTGTVVAEQDAVAWLLTKDKWKELEKKHPEIATELLKIGLKLTLERMNAITSYILVEAT